MGAPGIGGRASSRTSRSKRAGERSGAGVVGIAGPKKVVFWGGKVGVDVDHKGWEKNVKND